VENVEKTAGRIYDEMAPYLQKGYILSFSTPNRGYTGIISQHDLTWSFINSGHLDNQVNQTRSAKGVGEEDLTREIRNWCRVAARRSESLMITLGRLQAEKLRTARRENTPSPQRVLSSALVSRSFLHLRLPQIPPGASPLGNAFPGIRRSAMVFVKRPFPFRDSCGRDLLPYG
jgi:hypothetical protein